MKLAYDLHIHSGLSPCAQDDMSPQNIVRMAKLKGLDLIAICDHNSMKQQKVLLQVADEHGLQLWFGVELESTEEVHSLAYFKQIEDVQKMQTWIESVQVHQANNVDYFGHQYLYTHQDEIQNEEKTSLIMSLNASLKACGEAVHTFNGRWVLAHIYDRKNSITQQLGFIPQDLAFDGIEVNKIEDEIRFRSEYPQYANVKVFINSDAHTLGDIHEHLYTLSSSEIDSFWRKPCKTLP